MTIETQIIELIAADRIDIPISSMSGKLKRQKPKLAQAVSFPGRSFIGERVYARLQEDDITEKARTMSEAIEMFSQQYERHGEILKGMIAETRQAKENNLYFGVIPGCRLTADDYIGVMANLGFTEATARRLYPELMNVSRKIQDKREYAERSILVE